MYPSVARIHIQRNPLATITHSACCHLVDKRCISQNTISELIFFICVNFAEHQIIFLNPPSDQKMSKKTFQHDGCPLMLTDTLAVHQT